MISKTDKPTNEMLGFVEDEDGSLRINDIVIPPPPVAIMSHDVPESRLLITELRIKNFKSYANEVVLGSFDKNFTAVVGPNGSGKSNVIDSLLFVFGYRAKKIRSKKLSNLIHKSEQYPHVPSCTVTVKFAMIKETEESYTVIDGTEFTLTRTAFQDDSSFYEMNKKRVPYKEVAKALRKYFIDLDHSRFLILQGEIEAISLMHPKAQNEHETGMLEYIEDIIGSNRYIEPISRFSEELEKLNEEKKEKLNSLKLVEKEKDDLEEPKNKAISYLKLENQLILNENSMLHCKRYAVEKELEEILSKKKDAVKKLDELKEEISKFKASRKAQEEQMEKISGELDSHVKNFEKFKESYNSLEREDIQMYEKIKSLKAKKSGLESKLSSTETDLAKMQKQLETYENETAELTKMKDKYIAEKHVEDEKLSEVMEVVNKKTPSMRQEKDQLEAVLVKKMDELQQLQCEKNLLEVELKMVVSSDKEEKEKLADFIKRCENTEKKTKEEEILLKNEQKKIIDLQKESDEILLKKQEYKQTHDTLSVELRNVNMKFEEAKNSLNQYANRTGVMKAFNTERAKGNFKGIIGRLGDLGAIDQKYDVAISTAAPALNNILTDNMDTAQSCVEHLKRNNLGWCTFIALDKQQYLWPQVRKKSSMPENVPRLIDLVHVKNEDYLPAFYHALRDTLVAKDLEQATRIALQGSQRHRVVTLKGELIEMSGTMSGGGGRVSRGLMGQTVVECSHSNEDVAKLSEEKDSLARRVAEIKASLSNFEDRTFKIKKELTALNLSVKKRQSNYEAYVVECKTLKAQIEAQKLKVKNSVIDEKQVAELKNKITQKEKVCNAAAEETSAIKKKVEKLQDDILHILKGGKEKVKKNVDKLNKKIDEITTSITKSLTNAKQCRKKIKKAEEIIINVKEDMKMAEETKAKLVAQRDKCVSKARDFLTQQDEAQAAIDELGKKKSNLKKMLETVHGQEHQLKLAEINLKNEMKELAAIEAEKRAFIKSYTMKIGKLKLNEVENDSTDIPVLSNEDIEKISMKRLHSDIDLIRVQLEEMKPDLSAIEEYKQKEKLCNEKQKDLDDIVQQRNMHNMRYEELRKRRLTEFMHGFTAIAKKLKEIYQMLTLGGDAEMELVDTFDPFSKGIEFSVRPPRKSWKFMRNLSGGEKTLSSLALVFALHYYRPTPFYVMDEIDAALDVRNVAIVAYFLKERQKNTQFIIVSLRNIMNELADHLIGIYKTGNISKNVSLCGASKWMTEDEEED